ncbi:hypothetical protein ACU8KH_03558 [Lachancea thermotolerans]
MVTSWILFVAGCQMFHTVYDMAWHVIGDPLDSIPGQVRNACIRARLARKPQAIDLTATILT